MYRFSILTPKSTSDIFPGAISGSMWLAFSPAYDPIKYMVTIQRISVVCGQRLLFHHTVFLLKCQKCLSSNDQTKLSCG